jgi:hypothetical protein
MAAFSCNSRITAIWFLLLLTPVVLARPASVVVGSEDSLLAALHNQTVETIALLRDVHLPEPTVQVLQIDRYSSWTWSSTELRHV